MKWYISKLVFRIETESAVNCGFDLQYRLVQAASETEALEAAFQLARTEELVFVNAAGETIHWTFAGIAALHMLDAFEPGMLLISETAEPQNTNELLHSIKYPVQPATINRHEACAVC